MVTHEEALESADKLAEYCQEHFGISEEFCHECVYQHSKTRRCILKFCVGVYGEEMRSVAKEEAQKNYKRFTGEK